MSKHRITYTSKPRLSGVCTARRDKRAHRTLSQCEEMGILRVRHKMLRWRNSALLSHTPNAKRASAFEKILCVDDRTEGAPESLKVLAVVLASEDVLALALISQVQVGNSHVTHILRTQL